MNETAKVMTLDMIAGRREVIVFEINGGWGFRQRINQMGIHVGDRLKLKRSGILRGPLLVQVHGLDVALGRGMARKITVSEIE